MVFSDFNLLQAYALRSLEVCQLHEHLSSLEEEIARLKELIKAQQDALFGKKSEASKFSQDEALSGEDTLENNTHAGTTTVAAHSRKTRGSRTLDTKSLPKYTVIHDLPQEQKECACFGV